MTRMKSVGLAASLVIVGALVFLSQPSVGAAPVFSTQVGTGGNPPTPSTPPALAPTPGNTTTTAAPTGSTPNAGPTSQGAVVLRANLGPGQVNPKPKGVPAGATGQFAAVVTDGRLTWALSNVKLSGVPNARLESGKPGKNGVTVVTLCGKCGPAVAGTIALTDDQEDDLRAGPLYIELNTPKNPKGELRGQIRG